MKRYVPLVLCLLVLSLDPVFLPGQSRRDRRTTECRETLQTAQKDLREERLDLIDPIVLERCLRQEESYTALERVQAYKVLIQVFADRKESQQAEKAMLDLLKIDPNNEVFQSESLYLKTLSQQVREKYRDILGNSCSERLRQAQEDFGRGKLWEIAENTLHACIESGFSKVEKLQAYRLLTMVYLFREDQPHAEEMMLALLSQDPEHRILETDPPEFRNLYNRFQTRPIYALRLSLGPNVSLMRAGQIYGLDNTQGASGPFNPLASRKLKLGWQFRMGLDFFLPNPHWEFGAELGYTESAYEYQHTQRNLLSGGDNQFSELSFVERQNWGALTALFRYSVYQNRRTGPYFNLGASYQYLFYSEIDNISRRTLDNGAEVASPISGLAVRNLKALRERHNLGLVMGAGLNIKLRRHLFFVEARGVAGLTNLVQTENRYSNAGLVYNFGYVDPDLYLNQLMVSLGYSYSFYQVKLKQAK